MTTINDQLLAKAQKEADDLLINLDFPKFRVLPLDENVHCMRCEEKQGVWYHKCTSCGLTLPTRFAFSMQKPRTPNAAPHVSYCRKCTSVSTIAWQAAQTTSKGKRKKKIKISNGNLRDLTMAEIIELPPRRIEIALLNARNERNKLEKEITLLEQLKIGKDVFSKFEDKQDIST